MAPPLPGSPHRSEGTIRCAPSSSSSSSKESSWFRSNRRQGRQFSATAVALRRRFRRAWTSSAPSEYTTKFLMLPAGASPSIPCARRRPSMVLRVDADPLHQAPLPGMPPISRAHHVRPR
nr:uncharacterized protein LOC127295298 isoform X1 [Lolium perenne]XP_051181187.1 uncharacterized protein LOC127295298 isoform X2 [Lolium perenne]